jgi:hypothetical protein
LAYPELLPEELHTHCLYESVDHLVEKVQAFLRKTESFEAARNKLQETAYKFAWEKLAPRYDEALNAGFEELS